ncbi:MAG: pyridoxamine 5'-phosphate oxidase family protein [Microlunatus sp.]
MTSDTAAKLRAIPSLTGTAPPVDLQQLPADPVTLFYEWLDAAIDARVPEPAAATLSTVDEHRMPDARTLIIKDVDAAGWAFAGTASSGKGHQLAAHPAAALNIWWQPLMRTVRLRGPVVEASPEESAADLAARSEAARSAVAPGDWRLWRIQPIRVEFWQGATDRRHLRIVYTFDDGWDLNVTGR